MFGISMPEVMIIAAIALIVIGPKKLPEIAKSLGRVMGEFKRAADGFKDSMEVDDEIGDVKDTFDDLGYDIKDSIDAAPQALPDDNGEADPQGKDSGDDKKGSNDE